MLKWPVQTFLGSNDRGRDGVFLGALKRQYRTTAKSTIQCKFTGVPGANLTLAALQEELPKPAVR